MTEHGIFGRAPERRLPLLAAPTTANEFNTLREPIEVVACAQMPNHHFDFDSSFVKPDVAGGLKRLGILRQLNPDCPATIFGHADPVGNDDYNKTLSGRRALAIYGLVIHDTSIWENLFSHASGNDNWGAKSIQAMLKAVGNDPGRTDGVWDTPGRNAVKAFQHSKGLPEDGDPGPNTRRELFAAYMDFLYGTDFQAMDKAKDFLARNADGGGKGDYQGCSEFNPLRMFSRAQNQQFESASDKTERNARNEVNRRVMVYLFKRGTQIDPGDWPCPRASEGVAGCKKRFFSDAATRRQFQEQPRQYHEIHDTFACRFYQRVVQESPCERPLVVDWYTIYDELDDPVTMYRVDCLMTSGQTMSMVTDASGQMRMLRDQCREITINDIHSIT